MTDEAFAGRQSSLLDNSVCHIFQSNEHQALTFIDADVALLSIYQGVEINHHGTSKN